jgi:hypothetical protein
MVKQSMTNGKLNRSFKGNRDSKGTTMQTRTLGASSFQVDRHHPLILALVGIVVLIVISSACTTDADRIREANNLAGSQTQSIPTATVETQSIPTATVETQSSPLSADISVFELKVGDCIGNRLLPDSEVSETEIIECTGDWTARVISNILIEAQGSFPGDAYFGRRGFENCGRLYSNIMMPTRLSWEQGDRVLTCIQDGAGFDHSKVGSVINSMFLELGHCFYDIPESNFIQVLLVSCSQKWQFRVVDVFNSSDGAGSNIFPGEAFLDREANEECPPAADNLLAPTPDSWEVGDRAIVCLKEYPS